MPPSFADSAESATAWVHRENASGATADAAKGAVFAARLTIDGTPALRGRIKVIAFGRGITAADMLRELREREFAEGKALARPM